jgi:hypothetical protein
MGVLVCSLGDGPAGDGEEMATLRAKQKKSTKSYDLSQSLIA